MIINVDGQAFSVVHGENDSVSIMTVRMPKNDDVQNATNTDYYLDYNDGLSEDEFGPFHDGAATFEKHDVFWMLKWMKRAAKALL